MTEFEASQVEPVSFTSHHCCSHISDLIIYFTFKMVFVAVLIVSFIILSVVQNKS